MKRASAVIAVLAIFVVGVVAGVAAAHLYYARLLTRPGGPPAIGAQRFSDHLARRLRLSRAQEQQVAEILARTQEKSERFREQMEPRVRDLLETTHREIEDILSKEQRERFREMRETRQRRMEQFLLGPSPGRDHGPMGRRGPPPFADGRDPDSRRERRDRRADERPAGEGEDPSN